MRYRGKVGGVRELMGEWCEKGDNDKEDRKGSEKGKKEIGGLKRIVKVEERKVMVKESIWKIEG